MEHLKHSKNVWHVYTSVAVLAPSGQRPGMLLTSHNAQGKPLPPAKIYPAPNANSVNIDKSDVIKKHHKMNSKNPIPNIITRT